MNRNSPNRRSSSRSRQKHAKAAHRKILSLFGQETRPLTLQEVAGMLRIAPREIPALETDLLYLTDKGKLLKDRRNRYCATDKLNIVQGRVSGHPDGYGFLVRESGPDLYLAPRQMRRAMDGDIVLARVKQNPRDSRLSGSIVEILQRRHTRVTGTVVEEQNNRYLIPDNRKINQDILIEDGAGQGPRNGQIATVEIRRYPDERHLAVGTLVEVLGNERTPALEVEITIRKHDLPYAWPKAVQHEVQGLPDRVLARDKRRRVDLTRVPFITIDGEDARDFDDAVFAEKTDDGFLLRVAIADVAHYVKPGGALDQEAVNRGTSVYLPDRVLPMLPEKLSEKLCSLQPEQDRLALVCSIAINRHGDLQSYTFCRGIIHSRCRTTYSQVADFLAGGTDSTLDKPTQKSLACLFELYRLLDHQRKQRGTIEFDTEENRIILDEAGRVEAIEARQRNDAHKLIEECMILANRCAAQFLSERNLPFLSRVHQAPEQEKVQGLREFLREFHLSLAGQENPQPLDYAELLDQARSRPDYPVIQKAVLRSMQRAVYAPEAKGHFGLALDAYTHFTSPIRRYPDLLTHRAIVHALRNGKRTSYLYGEDEMRDFGEQCSLTELRADQAVWDMEAWLKCEFISHRLGEKFQGTVSAVTGFGLFVTLDDLFIDGLVHVTTLPADYYRFEPGKHCLIGEKSGIHYRLGDRLSVQLAAVNLEERKIDLLLL